MGELASLRVLVVEDEGGIALLIEDMLEQLGCEVVGSIATLDKALTFAATQSFDCALLDVNLAGRWFSRWRRPCGNGIFHSCSVQDTAA
jgi:CheY-like chemotaxis protein